MKNVFLFLGIVISAMQNICAQCTVQISITPPISCISSTDTLLVHGAQGARTLTWISGDTVRHTASHTFSTNAVTVAGGNGNGIALNQLGFPGGICMDRNGYLYIADKMNYRIARFPPGSLQPTAATIVAAINNPSSVYGFSDIFVDSAGYIYATDGENNRVMRFPPGSTPDSTGVVVAGGNGYGNASNQLAHPFGIYMDRDGALYVSDPDNYRVQKFPPGSDSLSNGLTVAGGNGQGAQSLNQLWEPMGIYVSDSGDLYIADYGSSRLLRFPLGSSASTYGVVVGRMSYPTDVWLGPDGSVYATDGQSVIRYLSGSSNATGETVAAGHGQGSGADQLSSATGLFTDVNGDLYVSDAGNKRIQRFSNIVGVDTTYMPADTGYYIAIVTDISGCSDTAYALVTDSALCRDTSGATSITNMSQAELVKIFPTPASEILYISLNDVPRSIALYDVEGRAVFSWPPVSKEYNLDISILAQGIYILKADINGSEICKRVAVE